MCVRVCVCDGVCFSRYTRLGWVSGHRLSNVHNPRRIRNTNSPTRKVVKKAWGSGIGFFSHSITRFITLAPRMSQAEIVAAQRGPYESIDNPVWANLDFSE